MAGRSAAHPLGSTGRPWLDQQFLPPLAQPWWRSDASPWVDEAIISLINRRAFRGCVNGNCWSVLQRQLTSPRPKVAGGMPPSSAEDSRECQVRGGTEAARGDCVSVERAQGRYSDSPTDITSIFSPRALADAAYHTLFAGVRIALIAQKTHASNTVASATTSWVSNRKTKRQNVGWEDTICRATNPCRPQGKTSSRRPGWMTSSHRTQNFDSRYILLGGRRYLLKHSLMLTHPLHAPQTSLTGHSPPSSPLLAIPPHPGLGAPSPLRATSLNCCSSASRHT